MSKNRKNNCYTFFRFPMVWVIAISHIILFYDIPENHFIYIHFCNPVFVVNFFFLLSGFGLTLSSIRKEKEIDRVPLLRNSIRFAMVRVKKLYWLYLLTMFVMVLLNSSNIWGMIHQLYLFAIGSTLLQSLSCNNEFAMMLNAPCWFISTLFILYIAYPFCEYVNLKLLNKAGGGKILLVILIIGLFIYLGVSNLFVSFEEKTGWTGINYVNPIKQLIPFVLGGLLCDYLYKSKIDDRISETCFTFMEVLIIITTLMWYVMKLPLTEYLHENIITLMDLMVPMLLLSVFYPQKGKVSTMLNNSFLVKLGGLSMYIFLLHWPIGVFVIRRFVILNAYSPKMYVISLIFVIGIIIAFSVIASIVNRRIFSTNKK